MATSDRSSEGECLCTRIYPHHTFFGPPRAIVVRSAIANLALKLAHTLVLSPACEQQVIQLLDKGFIGNVEKESGLGEIELVRLVYIKLHETRRTMITFAKWKVQWNSCGSEALLEVLNGLS
jgi:hypothetical protein